MTTRRAHRPEWRGRTDAELSEADWQAKVIYLGTMCRFQHFHPRVMQGSKAGWPDLSFWRPPDFFMVELKTERGKLRPEQERVIAELRSCGLEVLVWRPRDFREVVLRFGAR